MPARKTKPRSRSTSSRVRVKEAPAADAPPVSSESPFRPGFAPECLMCPFGLFFFSLRQTRPEALEHLLKAGHELFLAFRAVTEQLGERWEQAQTLQRITVR